MTICTFCGQPVTNHIGSGWFRGQRVHGECVWAVWLTGRLPDPLNKEVPR